jgi:hypothetical protein
MKPDQIEELLEGAQMLLSLAERPPYGEMSEMEFTIQKSIDAAMSDPTIPMLRKVRERHLRIKEPEIDECVPFNGCYCIDENDNEVPLFHIEDMRPVIYDDDKGERIIAQAISGDFSAHQALCFIAGSYILIGCAMPERLRFFVCFKLMQGIATESKGRGRAPLANRNYKIGWAINELARTQKLRPTRNRAFEGASNNLSACSVIKRALERRGVNLSESTVEKIWQDYCRDYPERVSSANRPK